MAVTHMVKCFVPVAFVTLCSLFSLDFLSNSRSFRDISAGVMKLLSDARRFYLHSLSNRCWIKADTLPPSLQAEMAQAFDKNKHIGMETTDQSDCIGDLVNAICRLSLGVMDGIGSDDLYEAPEALSVESGRRPSQQQSIKAAEGCIFLEDDQGVVETIRFDCQDKIIDEAADDGEGGGGESSKSDGSKRQDSEDTDDDLVLGDTEGPETLKDLPLMPFVEISESFRILEAVAEKSRISHKVLISFGSRK